MAHPTKDTGGYAMEAGGEIRPPSGTYIRIPEERVEEAKSALDFWEVVPD